MEKQKRQKKALLVIGEWCPVLVPDRHEGFLLRNWKFVLDFKGGHGRDVPAFYTNSRKRLC